MKRFQMKVWKVRSWKKAKGPMKARRRGEF